MRQRLSNYTPIAGLFCVGLAVLFVDFLSKAAVYNLLPAGKYSLQYPFGGMGVFHDFLGVDFAISLAVNKGAAWGMFAHFQYLLIAVRMLVILGMLFYLFFINRSRRLALPLVLIISGALGNVVDFFLYGYVVDFLYFNLWGYHFPVFNIADSAITVGAIWLFAASFCQKSKKISC